MGADRMWSYAEAEAALARLHMCPPEKVGALRGRLQHLQKLGMKPSSPGKGKRIAYEVEDIAKWALALELAEFGVDPIAVKTIVDKVWDDARRALVDGTTGDDQLLVTNPEMLSRTYSPSDAFTVRVVTAASLTPGGKGLRRSLMVNLTEVHRELVRALEWVRARA